MLVFPAFSQNCFVTVTPLDTLICPGDSVQLTAVAGIASGGQSFNFDGGSLPPGWSTTGSATYSTPCGAGPNGSSYFWAATAGSGTPTVTTAGFDVGCGGNVVFEMLYSVQSGGSPCEGPDLANEGVELQYSIDGGLTWVSIIYYSPGGFTLPATPASSASVASGVTPYTTWNSFSVPIPPAAMTANTMFRWIQFNSSGTCCDNWGLEDISIQAGPCASAVVNWSNGYMDTNQFYVSPVSDSVFIAYVYDTLGVLQCVSDSIFINISGASLTFDLEDTVYIYCAYDSVSAEVTNIANALAPFSYSWSNGDTTSLTYFNGTGIYQDTSLNYVTVTDGCGFSFLDSVLFIVDQTLTLDSLTSIPSSFVQPPNCLPSGVVQAYVSGLTEVLGLAQYSITGPNTNPGGITVNGTSAGDLPPGWYYFTVTDDVCTLSDSVEVTSLQPPVAVLSANTVIGCSPLSVTFSNSSQNTDSYFWDFGNSNTLNIPNENSQSATYSNSTQVMLIAFDSNNCSDTTYLNIDIIECGCMNSDATNYNPAAVQDDGSCVFPIPIAVAPNVFTPNGDTDNDIFFIKTELAVKLQLTIINRWGNLMYEKEYDLLSPGPEYGWNGLAPSGKEAEEGTYFYKYIATGINGDEVGGHGFLHLVRDKK